MTIFQIIGLVIVIAILGFASWQFGWRGGKREQGRTGMPFW